MSLNEQTLNEFYKTAYKYCKNRDSARDFAHEGITKGLDRKFTFTNESEIKLTKRYIRNIIFNWFKRQRIENSATNVYTNQILTFNFLKYSPVHLETKLDVEKLYNELSIGGKRGAKPKRILQVYDQMFDDGGYTDIKNSTKELGISPKNYSYFKTEIKRKAKEFFK